jgi:hypothetical protein
MISNSKKTVVSLLPVFLIMTGLISSCSDSDSQLMTSVPFDQSESPGSINAVTPSTDETTQVSVSRAWTDYPTCASASSDPDGDGWGWENNKSCKVAAVVSSSTTIYPTCASASSDPDGDGWGWENNRSCKVAPGSSSSSNPTQIPSTTTPTSACPSGASCGSYAVNGLGSRKQQILNAGGTTLDIAIAMLESDNMGTDYAYGDYKTDDASNFGIFKQNWGMLRTACTLFQGQSQPQWNNGAVLNSNLNADILCRRQSEAYYGLNRWFAGHRNGSTGLANPNTADIKAYMDAVYWIKGQIDSNSANLSNNIRFYVYVPAI